MSPHSGPESSCSRTGGPRGGRALHGPERTDVEKVPAADSGERPGPRDFYVRGTGGALLPCQRDDPAGRPGSMGFRHVRSDLETGLRGPPGSHCRGRWASASACRRGHRHHGRHAWYRDIAPDRDGLHGRRRSRNGNRVRRVLAEGATTAQGRSGCRRHRFRSGYRPYFRDRRRSRKDQRHRSRVPNGRRDDRRRRQAGIRRRGRCGAALRQWRGKT